MATEVENRGQIQHFLIRIAGPLLWNSLDSNIKSVTGLNTFTRKLKNLLAVNSIVRGMSGRCDVCCQLKC